MREKSEEKVLCEICNAEMCQKPPVKDWWHVANHRFASMIGNAKHLPTCCLSQK